MRIWVHDLGTAVARPLPGTEEGYRPFWSPDGRRIGFFTWSHLATTPSEGGAVDASRPGARRARRHLEPERHDRLRAVRHRPAARDLRAGGRDRQVTGSAEELGAGTHRFPQFLPDGEHFVYLDRRARFGSARSRASMLGRLGSTERLARSSMARRTRSTPTAICSSCATAPWSRSRSTRAPRARRASRRCSSSDLLFNRRFTYGVFSASESRRARLSHRKAERSLRARLARPRRTPSRRVSARRASSPASAAWRCRATVAGPRSRGSRREERRRHLALRSGARHRDPPRAAGARTTSTRSSRRMAASSSTARRAARSRRSFDATCRAAARSTSSSRPTRPTLAPMSVSPDGAWLACDRRHRSLQSDLLLLPTAAGRASRESCSRPRRTTPTARSLPTAAGCSGLPTSRAATRSTSRPSPEWTAASRSRATAARSRAGTPTAARSSSRPRTTC